MCSFNYFQIGLWIGCGNSGNESSARYAVRNKKPVRDNIFLNFHVSYPPTYVKYTYGCCRKVDTMKNIFGNQRFISQLSRVNSLYHN